jgi:ABC-type glycerol-3-phosphate transport system substrate-binding protein
MKKALVIIIVFALLFGTCACGGGKKADSITDEGMEYGLKDFSLPQGCTLLTASGDTVYYLVDTYDEGSGNRTSALYRTDIQGKQPVQYTAYPGDDLYYSQCCSDGENGFWIYRFADAPQEKDEVHELMHLQADGSIDVRTNLDFIKLPEKCLPRGIACSAAGVVYLMCGGNSALLVALNPKDMTVAFTLGDVSNASQLVMMKSGEPAVVQPKTTHEIGDYEGTLIRVIDEAKHAWGQSRELASSYNPWDGGDYTIYLTKGSDLYGYDLDTNSLTRIANCVQLGLESWTNIQSLGGGRFLLLATGEKNDGFKLMEQTGVSKNVTKLTVATLDGDSLRTIVADFNRTHGDIKIELADYSDGDAKEGAARLSTEINSGNVPDIIDLSALPAQYYIRKGILADLYPYIDRDNDIDRKDMWPGLLSGLEYDGGLYELVPSFTLVSVAGRADALSSVTNILDVFDAGKGSLFGGRLSKEEFLRNALEGSCDKPESIRNVDFEKLLAAAKVLPDSAQTVNTGNPDGLTGDQKLLLTKLHSPGDIDTMKFFLGGDVSFAGFSAQNGCACTAEPNMALGITEKCGNKQAAWEFLRMFLSDDVQRELKTFGVPMRISAYNKFVEEEYIAKTPAGEQSLMVGDTALTAVIQPEKSAAQFRSLLENVQVSSKVDEAVYDIVSEEAAAYFAGARTAAETAKLIQNRVNIYLSEQWE